MVAVVQAFVEEVVLELGDRLVVAAGLAIVAEQAVLELDQLAVAVALVKALELADQAVILDTERVEPAS